ARDGSNKKSRPALTSLLAISKKSHGALVSRVWHGIRQLAILLFLFADVAEHVRMDVQSDVGHVVEMFSCNKPDYFADLAFGIILGHACKGVWVDRLVPCKFRHIVQRRALCIGKER